jgi:hypothetical protein
MDLVCRWWIRSTEVDNADIVFNAIEAKDEKAANLLLLWAFR